MMTVLFQEGITRDQASVVRTAFEGMIKRPASLEKLQGMQHALAQLPTDRRVDAVAFAASQKVESTDISLFVALVLDGCRPEQAMAAMPKRAGDGDAMVALASHCDALPLGALTQVCASDLTQVERNLLLRLLDGRDLDQIGDLTELLHALGQNECASLVSQYSDTGVLLERELRRHLSPVARPTAASIKDGGRPIQTTSSEHVRVRSLRAVQSSGDHWRTAFERALVHAETLPPGFADQCRAARLDTDTLLIIVALMADAHGQELQTLIDQTRALSGSQRRAVVRTIEKHNWVLPLDSAAVRAVIDHDLPYEATKAFLMLASELDRSQLDALADACGRIRVEDGWQYAASLITTSAEARGNLAARLVVGMAPGNDPLSYGALQQFCDETSQRLRVRSSSFRSLS